MPLGGKLKTYLTLLILTNLIIGQCFAGEGLRGNYTQIEKGASAPFSGWCFDNQATGEIFASLKHAKEKCDLRLEESMAQQKAEYSLKIGNLKLRVRTLEEQHREITLLKDAEIEELETAALKRPNDYVAWWAAGGFLTGATTVLIIFFAVN